MGQSVDIEDVSTRNIFYEHKVKHDSAQATEKAKTWAYLYRYFPGVRKIINAMASGSINSPQNAMTMVPSLHTEFGNFNFGLSHRGVSAPYSYPRHLFNSLARVPRATFMRS